MEFKTAKWADKYGSVYIIAGPIIFNKTPSKWLGQENEVPVAIPDAFFKIVIREEGNGIKTLAFIYPHEGVGYRCSDCNYEPYLTSIDIIEALTGLDFNIHGPPRPAYPRTICRASGRAPRLAGVGW